MLTLLERKSLYLSATALPSKEAAVCAKSITKALEGLPEGACRTLTLGDGAEFARHEEVAQALLS